MPYQLFVMGIYPAQRAQRKIQNVDALLVLKNPRVQKKIE
jgi:hypothetical protein